MAGGLAKSTLGSLGTTAARRYRPFGRALHESQVILRLHHVLRELRTEDVLDEALTALLFGVIARPARGRQLPTHAHHPARRAPNSR